MLITKTFKQWLARDVRLANPLTAARSTHGGGDRIVAVTPLEGQTTGAVGAKACAGTCRVIWVPQPRIEVNLETEANSVYQINAPVLLEMRDIKALAPLSGLWEFTGAMRLQASFRGIRVGGLTAEWSGHLNVEQGTLELVVPALARLDLQQTLCFSLTTDGRNLEAMEALLRAGPEAH